MSTSCRRLTRVGIIGNSLQIRVSYYRLYSGIYGLSPTASFTIPAYDVTMKNSGGYVLFLGCLSHRVG